MKVKEVLTKWFLLAMLLVAFLSSPNLVAQTPEIAAEVLRELYSTNVEFQKGPKVARLTWAPPTQRLNGDQLTSGEIAGYNLFVSYPDLTTEVIPIDGGDIIRHEIPLTMLGLYTFALSTVDSDGLHSVLTEPVSTVNEQSNDPNGATEFSVSIQIKVTVVE